MSSNKIIVSGTLPVINVQIELSPRELAVAIMQHVNNELGGVDDAGCDWYTNGGNIHIANDPAWVVATDRWDLATLVNAANILHYGKPFKLGDSAEMEVGE